MPDYPDFVTTLKRLHLKRKGNRPKVSPQKFYPSQVELRTQELIREELGEYGYRLADAASKGGVQGVYDVPGAVPQGFDEKVQKVAEAVSLFQVRAFANFSELAVGERYFPGGNEQRDIILSTWSDNFVNLCKSTNEEMRKKVAGVVSDGVLGGRNIRDLTKDIQNTCSEFTRNKAELIATTEVGKLNTAIARNQSESAGIRFYEWSAAMDGRTRESHAVMDGKICKWGDDDHYYAWETQPDGKRKLVRKDRPANAYKGAPGTDFRCRCTALPYVPEYEDDYEAEREKGPVQGVKQGEHAEPHNVRTTKKILELSAKVSNFDKIIRAENAKTRKEQIEISKQLFGNVKDDVLEKLTLTSLKTLNKELPRAYNDVGITSIRNIATSKLNGVAGYRGGTFYINPQNFNAAVQNPKQFFKVNVTEEIKRNGIRHIAIDKSENVRRHLIDHEIGHLLFERYKNSGKKSELQKMIDLTKKNGDEKKISKYAFPNDEFDKEEFFAEVYAMFARNDTTLPNYLLDYVKKVKNG